MTFFSFSSPGKKKRKSSKSSASSMPSTSQGYGYHANQSTITLHRPIPGPIFPVQPYQQQPPSQPWASTHNVPYNQALISQPYLPYGPPQQQQHSVYGVPQGNGAPWAASTASLSSNVNQQNLKKKKSYLQIPSAVTGQLHAASQSVSNLNESWNQMSTQYLNQGAALCDRISSKFDSVITCMDEEKFSGDERDLQIYQPGSGPHQVYADSSRSTSQTVSTIASTSTNHFAKVWSYSNSRLPPYLPPLKLYIPTYPLLCLAAQYSLRVYDKPKGKEREDHFKASIIHGTKAMVLKSLPIDDMNTICFAIRGSQTFMDWAVNIRQAPTSPKGFLDDRGNLCHAGFLCVAKFMVSQVAKRLRTLLQEDPSRSTASLLITGHSAGGAVAQLLYAHMMSETVESELTYLTGFFKRVHCVTFGAPPVSLLPLQKPESKRSRKSLFFAFVNEGDPVSRADPAIVRSLLKLYATPTPSNPCPILSVVPGFSATGKRPKPSKSSSWSPPSNPSASTVWNIPASTLSLGGRIALLRERFGGRGGDDIEVCQVTDEMLREVVYGDPLCHTMVLYSQRIQILATRAATASAFG
ncbi:alpha/beta-hydrolase [Tothia fuscella]|uniref:Alpha/beta-hydrolase n=1 Tax=Tothia fuscella TaxID=1048955 RepID=A0A9P4NXU9_9PEZI|nr:alpha/beta-hydrolase [Tothia fuscella]